jgi:hypothetical protein
MCSARGCVKNFPHQINDLEKLTAALGVAEALIGAGANYYDGAGATLGDALAHAGIYGFRDKTLTVLQALQIEGQKPLGDQGSRTAGRDIRHFFELAQLIVPGPALTQLAKDILAGSGNLPLRNALWREAMLAVELGAAGHKSHPYRILLRLTADRPGLEIRKLMLALEADNDGPGEYQRILNLADMPFDQARAAINASIASARNAVKILPGIAEQVGDVKRAGGYVYPVSYLGVSEDSLMEQETPPDYSMSHPAAPTALDPANIAPIPNFATAGAVNVDLAAAIELRSRRIIEHQKTVTSLAQHFASFGYATYANPYDCLAHRDQIGGILAEVKTLDGSKADERRQSEKALGQLRGYAYYSVQPQLKTPKLREVAAYSAPPSDSVPFMAANDVYSAWRDNGQWKVADFQGNISNLLPDALLA